MNIYKYLWFFGTKPKDSEATFMPSGKTVEVSRDKTLLTAALDAGLDFPHNCKLVRAVSVSVSWLKVK